MLLQWMSCLLVVDVELLDARVIQLGLLLQQSIMQIQSQEKGVSVNATLPLT